jgi:hypothetical protein
MKYLLIYFFAFIGTVSQIFAQETDLKKIYTEITTTINSSLLTRRGAYEISGFIFYDRMKTVYEDSYNYNDESITETFRAEPGVGYFFIDNLSAGLLFSYLNQKQDQERTEQTLAGPIVKMYFGDKEWRPYLFTDYLFWTGDIMDGGEWDLGIGLLYHVSGNFGVTAQVKYGILFSDEKYIQEMNRIYVGFGIINFIL